MLYLCYAPFQWLILKRVLTAADNALFPAAEAGDKTSMEVDKKFGETIKLLRAFEKNFPFVFKDPTTDSKIGGTVTSEENMSDNPMSPSTILDSLEEKLLRVTFLSVYFGPQR